MTRERQTNPWAVLSVLCLGFVMTLVDLTIVNIAIPDMTDDLGASLDKILWVVNAYTLVLATLIITAGRLGDIRGKGNLFLTGVTVFTLASLACGLAQDPSQLIAFRALQGAGAAMLIPQTLSIITDVFPPEKRGAAYGVWGAVAGVSGAIGPTVGGLLVTHLDWRWVFFINIPVGALVLLLGVRLMPQHTHKVTHRFDLPGTLLASATLFCLAFGLIEGERYEWNGWIWTLIAASAVLLAVFLAYERGQQDNEPLLPFSLFKDRNFSLVNLVGIAVSFGVLGILLPTTIYLQSVLGFSALKTGLVLVPLALGSMVTAGPAGILSEKFGGRYILTAGLSMFGIGITWILLVADTDSSWTAFIGPLFVAGLGAGCTFAPMGSEVMRNVPPHLTGAASGVNNALRQVGSVLAGAVIGAVLQAKLLTALREQARIGAQSLPSEYRADFVGGFADGAQHVEVGTEQGAALPAGIPQDIADRMRELAGKVFGEGFVDALQPTMLVPAVTMFAGAALCLALKGGPTPSGMGHGAPPAQPQETESTKDTTPTH
ncbi:MFS transporter [Streptomyces palmae]|uniref:DHA2 family efflux MFS transporter permease subunit n=1 Tax=Streptomyces palmae TaxID=1701085 RepID=A0A4Z0G5K3_9ACTN|nr:MFS transporter [Streptomyces palmae]TGA89915.1 DHA2 family efflux MFS transporter permease subunit [Streptomyces palmae]